MTVRLLVAAGPFGSSGFCNGTCCSGVCSYDMTTQTQTCCASLQSPARLFSILVSVRLVRGICAFVAVVLVPLAVQVLRRRSEGRCRLGPLRKVCGRRRPQRFVRRPLRRHVLPRSDRHLRHQRQLRWPRSRSLL